MKLLKELPDFKTEDEECEFWATHDSSDYIDWKNAKPISFPDLRPTGVIQITLSDEEQKILRALAETSSKSFTALAEELIHEGLRQRLAA